MPKTLREAPPSSSIARLLDPVAASRALSPVDSDPMRMSKFPILTMNGPAQISNGHNASATQSEPAHHQPAVGEASIVKRELVLTERAEQTLMRLLEVYRRATGSRLSASHLARAMLRGVAACMDAVERESQHIGRLRLPSNARGREHQREQFEDILAEAFINGIRSAAAYRRCR